MTKASNSAEVKRQNRSRIAKYIMDHGTVSRQEIASALGYSLPTVFANVTELMNLGLIREAGEYGSTGGRKAKALVVCSGVRYAVGIDITKHHIRMLLLDLNGLVAATDYRRHAFCDSLEYYRSVSQLLESFLDYYKVDRKKLVGVGISIPGIIIPGRNVLHRSHILNVQGIDLSQFSHYISYPLFFDNDANCAAYAEVDRSRSSVYLFLGNTVGGAIYEKGQFHAGDYFKAGEFGHMIIHPGGKQCYCGKVGCMDAYCSAKTLPDRPDERLEDYFQRLAAGDEKAQLRWEDFLEDLAIGVSNLRMVFDSDIILGGYIGGYMDPYMDLFCQKLRKYNNFDLDSTYVRTGKHRQLSSALGAAQIMLNRYIDELEVTP